MMPPPSSAHHRLRHRDRPLRAARSRSGGRPLLVLANRLPVRRTRHEGRAGWSTSPGGLVSALTPVLRSAGGAWLGWCGSSGPAPEPFWHDGISNVPIAVSATEVEGHYDGFSNRTLWPLCHSSEPVHFDPGWWQHYREVNRRFAATAALHFPAEDQGTSRAPLVWIHDYHLLLAAQELRRHRPAATIGFFLHVPFPPPELFARLPWRGALLDGLLGADLIGFQTPQDAENFVNACRRLRGVEGAVDPASRIGGDATFRLGVGEREVRVGCFPISIDYERTDRLARSTATERRVGELRDFIGGSERKIVLGVDRLDYTKGIDLRLRAFDQLLRSGRRSVRDCVLVQSVVPSREAVPEYTALEEKVESLIGEINGNHSDLGRVAIHYLRRQYGFEELVALYRCADVMLVTPTRDGMNLIAKEFVAARTAEDGALVLSEFAGAAEELTDALLINPFDAEGTAGTLDRALELPAEEARRRMRSMRATLAAHTVYDWAEDFLRTLDSEPRTARRRPSRDLAPRVPLTRASG